MSGKKLMLL